MADIMSKERRSLLMSRIRSRNNKETELVVASLLRKSRIGGWRRHTRLPGKPDFAMAAAKVAIFVDGCFWHGCPRHGRLPKSRKTFWYPKIRANRERDARVRAELRRLGWAALTVWEHDLPRPAAIIRKIERALHRRTGVAGKGLTGK